MKKLFLLLVTLFLFKGPVFANLPIKYQAELDMGYSLGVGAASSDRVNFHTIHGIKIGDILSTGVGFGVDVHYKMSENGESVIPVYANIKRLFPVNDIVSPFYSMDVGVGIGASENIRGLSGVYLAPAVGVTIYTMKLQLGYNLQRISESGIGVNLHAIQFKIGLVF